MIGLRNQLQVWMWELIRQHAEQSEKTRIQEWGEVSAFIADDESCLGVSSDSDLKPFPLKQYIDANLVSLTDFVREKLTVDPTVAVSGDAIITSKDVARLLRDIGSLMKKRQ